MPIAISIRDLREIIINRLEAKYDVPLPFNISIPSNEWIRLQFWPTNPTSTRAMHYTGYLFRNHLAWYCEESRTG